MSSGLIVLLATWILLKMIIRCTILLLLQRKIVKEKLFTNKIYQGKTCQIKFVVYPHEQMKIVNVPCQGKLARVEGA